jgi:hypothetical protein
MDSAIARARGQAAGRQNVADDLEERGFDAIRFLTGRYGEFNTMELYDRADMDFVFDDEYEAISNSEELTQAWNDGFVEGAVKRLGEVEALIQGAR